MKYDFFSSSQKSVTRNAPAENIEHVGGEFFVHIGTFFQKLPLFSGAQRLTNRSKPLPGGPGGMTRPDSRLNRGWPNSQVSAESASFFFLDLLVLDPDHHGGHFLFPIACKPRPYSHSPPGNCGRDHEAGVCSRPVAR